MDTSWEFRENVSASNDKQESEEVACIADYGFLEVLSLKTLSKRFKRVCSPLFYRIHLRPRVYVLSKVPFWTKWRRRRRARWGMVETSLTAPNTHKYPAHLWPCSSLLISPLPSLADSPSRHKGLPIGRNGFFKHQFK